jgi:hypothetical protein
LNAGAVGRVEAEPTFHGREKPVGAQTLPRKAGEVERIRFDGNRYVLRWQKCGKRLCKSCPHGPYWYQVLKVNGREIIKYVGKDLVGKIMEQRTRRWLSEQARQRLPGIPCDDLLLPVERPGWLPEEDWRRLVGVHAEGRIDLKTAVDPVAEAAQQAGPWESGGDEATLGSPEMDPP